MKYIELAFRHFTLDIVRKLHEPFQVSLLMEEEKLDLNLPEGAKGTSSLFGGYTILAKSMMGSGLLGVAAACAQTGWVLGCIIAIIIPLLTFLSLHLLAVVAIEGNDLKTQPLTFFKLCESILGKFGGWFVEITLILKTFGASIVYLQVAGSMLATLIYSPDSMSISKQALTRLIQVGIAAFFSPFCFMEKISNTRYVNAIGLCCLFYILIVACIYFDPSSVAAETSLPPLSFLGVLSKLPVFFFAYCCHQNVFLCISETKNATIKRVDIIMGLACITGFIVYVPVQMFPYATFGKTVQDNFINNLPQNDLVTKIACACAAISVCISFPLQILPLRNSVCSLMLPSGKPSMWVRIIVAGTAILLSLGIALAVSSLGIVMAITGLIGGCTICYLAPSLLYVRRFKRDHTLWYLAASLLGLSLALYPLCLTGIILKA